MELAVSSLWDSLSDCIIGRCAAFCALPVSFPVANYLISAVGSFEGEDTFGKQTPFKREGLKVLARFRRPCGAGELDGHVLPGFRPPRRTPSWAIFAASFRDAPAAQAAPNLPVFESSLGAALSSRLHARFLRGSECSTLKS